ncbi:hypothetical protein KSP39_PZI001320 [Platanthera zijinensis]|uniref:Uncharacterized protein n=1 Tax=Platanthera zijinensis TaxID=2320716 RepID=A0AAP0GGD1_9ASPA
MRPQSALLENLNPYESISDEEELQEITYDIDCSKNLQSLYSHQKRVQSTSTSLVESITGDCHQPTFAAHEDFRQKNPSVLPKDILPSKSEIRNRILQTEHEKLVSSYTGEESLNDSGYESISDEEKDARPRFSFIYAADRIQRGFSSLVNENQQQVCEWPAILEEANELAGLLGKTYNSFNSSVVPEERRFHKGGRGGSRFRFSFRSLSNKEDFSRAFSSSKDETYNSFEEDIEVPGGQDYFEQRADEDTVSHLLGNILEENTELDNKPVFHKQLVGAASVSELLEDMHKANPSSRRCLVEDNTKGKEKQKSSSQRTLLYLGGRVLEDKDTPEFIGEISSEDEHIDQDHQIAQIIKGQTMADMFQEAFNTSTVDAVEIPRSTKLGFGYHGRLQKVMQLEKDGCMAHFKHLQTGQATSNESNCIDVRILSRTLEAKLTVCHCLVGEYKKSLGYEKISQSNCENTLLEGFEDGKTMKRTIIFSPLFCSHVDLEVGNIVCIHPPWKEVQVSGGETMILCSYFSPMKAQNL